MGLLELGGTNKSYLSVVDGKLTRRLKGEEKGAFSRKLTKGPNEGKTVWERYYRGLEGVIVGLKAYEHSEFKEQMEIEMKSGDEDFLITLPLNGRYAIDFMKKIPNIDFDEPVFLSPYSIQDENNPEKYNQGMSIKNRGFDGEKAPLAFTRENPNGLPEPNQSSGLGGKTKWDYTPQTSFLADLLMKKGEELAKREMGTTQGSEATEEDVTADLPF